MGKSTLKTAAPKTTTKTATTTKKAASAKLRRMRFNPDANTLAELDFQMPDGRDVTLFGLVLNESQTGCAVVLVTNEKLRKDDPCLCKVGKLAAVHGTVRWVMLLEKGLMKLGIEYTDAGL